MIQQILGIVGIEIAMEKVFSVAGICTNFQHFRLGIENLENYSNDAHVEGLVSMKQFMDMEEAVMEENEGLIDQVGHLNIKENDNRLFF